MNRVYCSIITNVTREQAKRLNLNASYLNNLISTLKSIHNNANLDVTDDLIKEYLKNNKDKLLDVQLAIPLYKIKEDPNIKRGGYSNNVIEIYKFNDKYTPQDWFNESAKLYEVTPFMLQNIDLFDSTKAIYTYQLYLWKLLAERGLSLYTMKPEEKAKYINSALKQLKQAKERYKDEFNVKINKAMYNFDNKNVDISFKIVPVLGNNVLYEYKDNVLLIRNNIKLTEIENYFKQNKEQFDDLLSNGYTKTDIYKNLDSQDKIRDFIIALAYNLQTINKTINNNGKEYKQTDEFRRVQEASKKLLEQGVSDFQRGKKELTDKDRERIGGILGRLLESNSNGIWNESQSHLTHTNKDKCVGTFHVGKVNGELFHDIFEVIRTYLRNGELVDLHDDYSNCKCYVTSDGLCGFAIESDGNLVSVFSLSPSTNKGFLYAIKDFVKQEGATHLDAYASPNQPLQEIYAKTLGFHTASTMDYNMEYDHDDIAKNHGNPQVVFMVNHEVTEPKHFDKDSYDEAKDYQMQQLKKDVSSLKELEKKIQSDSQKMKLSDDEKYYVDEKGNKYARVTSVISTEETRFDPNSSWILPSTKIGTGIDEFVRDFFDDKIKDINDLTKNYPNANQEYLKKLYDDLQKIKDKISDKYTIVSKDVTLKGNIPVTDKNGKTYNLNVAGTVDLLIYDNDGNFYIYDMKTHRSNNELYKDAVKLEKYKKQVSLYKTLFEKQYGRNVKGLALIPIHVEYPAPKGWKDGKAEYSAKENSNQLLIDGKEFKDANPVLEKTIPIAPVNVNIKYEDLTDENKELTVQGNNINSQTAQTKTQPFSITNATQKKELNPLEISIRSIGGKPSILSVKGNVKNTSIEFIENDSKKYADRTIKNINWSDITLDIAENFNTNNEILAKNIARNKYIGINVNKSVSDSVNEIYKQLVEKGKTKNIKLNITGNGINNLNSLQNNIDSHVYNIIKGLLYKGITIAEIRSGGQTGIDEAGAKAGAKLGIKTSILSPKGWTFKVKDGTDVSDKKIFVDRFLNTPQQNKTVEETKPTIAKTKIDLSHLDNDNLPMIGEQGNLQIDTESKYVKVARAFTPIEYSNRIDAIAHKFDNILSNLLEEKIEEYEELVENAETDDEKMQYLQELNELKGDNGRRKVLTMIDFDEFVKKIKYHTIGYFLELSDEEIDKTYAKQGGLAVMKPKIEAFNEYWDTVFEDACNKIEQNEGIRIIINEKKNKDDKTEATFENTENEDEKEEKETGDTEDGKEATGNDGWSYQVRMENPHDTISSFTKSVLRNIQKCYYNEDGNLEFEQDDIGNNRFLREDVAHATLLSEFSKLVLHPEDFVKVNENAEDIFDRYSFPLFEKLKYKYPWIEQVMDAMYDDERNISLFFSDFRKDFISYWTQQEENGKIKTIPLNKQLSSESAYKEVIRNYENRNLLTETSAYNTDGTLNRKNIEKLKKDWNQNAKIIIDLTRDFPNLTQENYSELSVFYDDMDNVFEYLANVARSFGFDITADDVEGLFMENFDDFFAEKENDFTKFETNVHILLTDSLKLKEGQHFITGDRKLRRTFTDVADVIGKVTDVDVNMSSFSIDGKKMPSYSSPNYFNTMMRSFHTDSYQEYIDRQYKAYDWFYDSETKEWKNEILRLLTSDEYTDREVRRYFTTKEIKILRDEDNNATKYEDWQPNQIKKAFVAEYFAYPMTNTEYEYGYFNLPILADSPVALFVRLPKFKDEHVIGKQTLPYEKTFKGKLTPLYRRLVKQEIKRIKMVQQRRKKGCVEIQNFDKRGLTFCFIPELNTIKLSRNANTGVWKEDDNGVLFTELYNSLDNSEKDVLIDDAINIINDNNFESFLNSYGADELVSTLSKCLGYNVDDENARKKLEEYFWNQVYWTSQLIQLTTTDLAFSKNGVDFQKRFKEIYAAGNKLNTSSRYGRKFEKTIYIKDNIITSSDYLHMKEVIDSKVNDGWLSKEDAIAILDKLRNINQTDAQAYRYLGSYRSVLDMMGLWTSDMEDFFEKLESGEELSETDKMKAFTIVWQQIKPFVYTQIDSNDGLGGRMKVPHQNKNSEFLLLTLYDMIQSPMNRSARFKGMDRFMKENDIDVIQFESAVKVGGQGYIDISVSEKKVNETIANQAFTMKKNGNTISIPLQDVKSWEDIKNSFDKALDDGNVSQDDYNTIMKEFEPSEQEVYDILTEYSKNKISETDEINEDGFNTSVVHYLPYEDYCIAQATPEHLFDTKSIFGSQHRNIVTSNMADDMEITVNGLTLKAKNEKGENEIKQFHDALIIENLLDSFNKLRSTFDSIQDLQKELFQMVKGNPKYGRDMLNALQIVKREINGTMQETFNIPLHNPATTNQLQELVNSLFKNRITRQKIKGAKATLASNFGFTRELSIIKGKDGGILGAECYLPFYTQKYLAPALVDKKLKNGQTVKVVDMKKVDKSLLKILGFRIPTESHYSMLPMIIKGFLPQQNGSTIMLPADITQIAGEDFDIDGRFLFIPESKLEIYDYKKAYNDYRNRNEVTGNHDNDILRQLKEQFDDALENNQSFKEWFEEHKEDYLLDEPRLKKVRYNINKPISENSLAARNNMIIDIEYAILSHPSTARKIFNPGNFDKIKVEARRLQILNDDKLLDKYIEFKGIERKDIASTILNESLDNLDDFLKKYQTERNPLLLDTFIYNHVQNMTGGKLIGIYANNTVGQSKFQYTNLNINDKFTFKINGRTIKSLHGKTVTLNGITTYISDNCAQFSAASVDNVKEPVLAKILQNTETASIAGTMAVAGMAIQEISLMFSQPLVREFILNGNGISKRYILFEFLKDYVEKYNLDLNSLTDDTTTKELVNNILDYKSINFDEITPDNIDENTRKILSNNVNAAMKFYNIMNIAYDFNNLIQISRADSPNGAMKRNIPSAVNQLHKVDVFHLRSQVDKMFTLENIEDCVKNNVLNRNDSIDIMREKLLKQKMPMLQAFHSLGIEVGLQLEDKFFVQQSPYVKRAVNMLYYNSPYNNLSDETLLSFYEDMSRFFLTKTNMFGDDVNKDYEEKRTYYLYKYPMKFLQTILNPKNKEIFDYGVMKQINVRNGQIGMENAGDITPQLREMYMRDFENMLYSDNPMIRQLAIDLFSYSFYNNGLNWRYRSFNKFFSTVFLNSFPEVINALDNMQSDISEGTMDNYLAQFYLNHWKEKNLLPHINITKDKILADSSILLDKKKSTNHNAIKPNPYQLIVLQERSMFTGETTFQSLYRLSDEQNSEEYISYVPVKTFKSEREKLYCIDRDEEEIIDSETDSKIIEEAKKLDYDNIEIVGNETSNKTPVNDGSNIESMLDDFENNNNKENALSKKSQDDLNTKNNVTQKRIMLDDPSILNIDNNSMFEKLTSGTQSKETQDNNLNIEDALSKYEKEINEGKRNTGEIKC